MGNRTLVRSDGSLLVVPEADAPRLMTLGYREQTPTEQLEAGISRGTEKYYTAPGQGFGAFVEGGLSGATLGLSDLLGGDDEADRARYNPGWRIAGELVGSLAPLAPGMLGAAARYTPVGLLTRGAEAAAETLGAGSKVIRAATQAGIEGAGLGAGAALTQAKLDGDPVTAEAIMAGMGWGALFGGGLGAAGGAVESRMERRAAKMAASEEARFNPGVHKAESYAADVAAEGKVHQTKAEWLKEEHANRKFWEDEIYARVDNTMRDATQQLKNVTSVVGDMGTLDFNKIKTSQFAIKSQMTENFMVKEAKPFFNRGQIDIAQAMAAAGEGKYEKMVSKLESYKDKMVAMETTLGGPKFFNSSKVVGQANDLIGLAKYRMETAVHAAEEATNIAAVHAEFAGFPKTVDEFVGMTPQRVEKLTAAIDQLGKLKSAELAGVQQAVSDAVGWMGKGLGITAEGSTGAQFREMWKQMKAGHSARTQEAMKMASEGNLIWKKGDKAAENVEAARTRSEQAKTAFKGKTAAQRGMESAARYGVGTWAAQKLGTPGYILGSSMVSAMVNMKGAILGTLADAAAKWVPKGARVVQKFGSRVEPLLTRLDGTMEDKERDRTELMQARAKEIAESAYGIRDTMFKAVEPLSMQHPELAQQLHMQAIKRFQFIMDKMPKDPGNAFSNLQSIWKPDAAAVEKFARYYEVFQNPVGVMTQALKTGKITMEAADGLKNMNPELWTYLRGHLLERVADPSVRKGMKYEDQVQMGMMLDIQLHSTMTPQFIAAQQQMYTERNKPLESNPRIQPGGGGGRPSGPGPNATSAQRITEH